MNFTSRRKKSSRSPIEGLVIPSNCDDNGNVSGVSIQTNDEKEYLAAITKTGKELLDHIHEKVNVHGKIRERLDGKTLISVQDYRTAEEEIDNDDP